MENLINDAIIPLINSGKISMEKVNGLIEIKEFVDRVSSNRYLIENPEKPFDKVYGVEPDIVTWGDYFQSDLSMDACVKTEEEFKTLIDTVKFDIMSAFEIFSSNSQEFYSWVEEVGIELEAEQRENYNQEELEIIHLNILKKYYFNMDINGKFTDAEVKWFKSFNSEEAVSS